MWRDVEMEIDTAGAVRAVLSDGTRTVEFVANFELGDRWVALRASACLRRWTEFAWDCRFAGVDRLGEGTT